MIAEMPTLVPEEVDAQEMEDLASTQKNAIHAIVIIQIALAFVL